jgi:quinol monooxygenase YgiN
MTTRVLYAEFAAVAGQEQAVVELLRGYGERVRLEPGNITFAAYSKEADARHIFVFEEYADEEAFQAHLAAPYGRTFNEALAPLVDGGGSTLTFLSPH